MKTDNDLEAGLQRRIRAFSSEKSPVQPPTAYAPTGKLKVTLKVRKKPMGADEVFVHTVNTLSELQAEIEARREAKAAGWPIVAYVQDVQKV
jgi:hypothetical protein